ncbi:C40 family peptidase [Corynebacterium lizhenjunii]|uniref:C40 family peptidase n=1 Tax=Corynebacterium lizhenjunii TaxID=2709394 RepID=A0A7T0KDJ7_9CORY|nr:C40 family peptidase [Corynebacterium lizhenjunii]QPK78524.1 C40 family peptidase [Corynebacterium lizhenjunii]
MAKHRRQATSNTRRVATTAALAATAAVTVPATAQGAEVVIPNTNFSMHIQGVENVPGIRNLPGIEAYVPSLAGQGAAQTNYTANVTVPAPAPAVGSSAGERVVAAARSAIGAPYGWGAAGPSSFDCSGLTSWAYAQVGKSIPRTSQAQAAAGQRVPLDQIQPGDIVAYYGGASHVGIYAGNGVIIDALNSGSTVGERPLHYMPIHSVVRF